MWRRVRRFFVSLNTASILLLLLALLTFVAGFFPQFPRDSVKTPSEARWWWDAARERYGLLFPALRAAGLLALYRSPLFWVLFLLLLAGAIFCSTVRIPGGFRLSRLGSVSGHLGLVLLAVGLALSGFFRHIADSPPLVAGEEFASGGRTFRVQKVWVERSTEDIPLAFGCELESGGKTLRLSPGWPGMAGISWLIPLSYGPAWKLKAVKPSGEPTSLLWKGVKGEGEITVPFPVMGEVQEIAFPEVEARVEISVQTQGAFVDFYERGKLARRLVVQEEVEIEGEGVRLTLSPENYVILRTVEDPGFWPAAVGAAAMGLGFGIALFTRGRTGD